MDEEEVELSELENELESNVRVLASSQDHPLPSLTLVLDYLSRSEFPP